MQIVTQTDIKEYPLVSRGKVRDIYAIDASTLLIVTTDRMSAFDVIMNEPIPYKGVVLNQITIFWMEKFKDIIANHLLATDVRDFPADLAPYADQLEGRSVLVKKAKPLPIECIVRGYITGSGWKDYQQSGKVCGYELPAHLMESQQLPKPLFTPSTKAELGEHDQNITMDKARELAGEDLVKKVENVVLSIYEQASAYARERDIIIADTKFEFGLQGKELLLIDEVLTPDSSRFWPVQGYEPGKGQPSFDKQFLRDWLAGTGWAKTPPPPTLPKEVIARTQDKYFEAFRLLTGRKLDL
ncbi:phosphoribosylaminoimidazolesuccinocarboxamide synthase [Desulfoplanes formicivorans]|uniref:Phosphoribosylaminoimidazole-succinocarboxamide synthase n=1 Tax=Desulfoplanes formicivorans TaxID=1592317 RepID=A0A194AE68_9BACT|nr:phosphoribosylaminoimidazolesuccinocarboxamide synthase [Desulfoplanes formicivorans]GAU07495.1 phosphoribosylaminoimidazole-succinocarboxamide synthase [Desulfoplanes formicivorans]